MSVDLRALFTSIHKAVSDASNVARDRGIENVINFFDYDAQNDHYTPKMIKLKFPQDSAETPKVAEVPLYTLAQHNSLFIDELKMNFNVEMNDTKQEVTAELVSNNQQVKSTSIANIEIRFKSGAATEGSMRINDKLIYQIPK